jgi:aryl-alcohol dehydrogenase-like predicted oxidoreductase
MIKDKIILGTVQLGLPYGINNDIGQISPSEAMKILEYGRQNNIHILDTAAAYGNSHQIIGEFHKNLMEKDKYKIITKLQVNQRKEIRQTILSFLEELQVNKLHAVLFHSFKSFRENKMNMESLTTLKKEGLIDFMGVSIYTNAEFEMVINDPDVDIVQVPFNLLDNVNKRGFLLKRAQIKGKIIHSRSCFLQGLFFSPLTSFKKVVGLLKKELATLHQLASKNNISMAQLALSYCTQQDTIDQVLIGVDSLEQLEANITMSRERLPEEVIAAINAINVKNNDLLNPSLWNQL